MSSLTYILVTGWNESLPPTNFGHTFSVRYRYRTVRTVRASHVITENGACCLYSVQSSCRRETNQDIIGQAITSSMTYYKRVKK